MRRLKRLSLVSVIVVIPGAIDVCKLSNRLAAQLADDFDEPRDDHLNATTCVENDRGRLGSAQPSGLLRLGYPCLLRHCFALEPDQLFSEESHFADNCRVAVKITSLASSRIELTKRR